jgi:MFS family permease
MTLVQELFTTTCDWKVASMGWMYTLFFVLLGIAAAVWGGWLERAGPARRASSRRCAGAAVSSSARSASTPSALVVWLGSGVIGGIGLGLGYISPVSTLVKWFPDRRGMATGMAIMGFGGGAMIGAPLATSDELFQDPDLGRRLETFVAMGVIYFVFMMIGAFRYRIPPAGWRPEGWTPPEKPTR